MTEEIESPGVEAAEAELDALIRQIKENPETQNNLEEGEEAPPPTENSENDDKPAPTLQQKTERPKGYDSVDLDGLPDEIKTPLKERLDYLYKQTKTTDEKNKILIDHNRKLDQAIDYLLKQEEARGHKEQVVEYDVAKQQIIDSIQEARDFGDSSKEEQLRWQYQRLEAWKETQDNLIVQAKQVKQQPVQQSPFSPEEIGYVSRLAKEEDESGNVLRPWLTKGDPNFDRATKYAKDIAEDLTKQGKEVTIERIIPRLDKYMSAKSTGGLSAVLPGNSGNLTPPGNNKTIKLSEGQRYSAKKLGIDLKSSGVDIEGQMAKLSKVSRVRLEDIV